MLRELRQRLRCIVLQCGQSVPTAVMKKLALHPAPQAFNGVEVGGIRGQELDPQPSGLLPEPGLQPFCLMKGSIVANQQDFIRPHFTFEMADKAAKAHGRHLEGCQHAIEHACAQFHRPNQIDPPVSPVVLSIFSPFSPQVEANVPSV